MPGEAMKMDFVPYIESLFPAMLMGITGANHLGYLGRMNISPSYAIAMY